MKTIHRRENDIHITVERSDLFDPLVLEDLVDELIAYASMIRETDDCTCDLGQYIHEKFCRTAFISPDLNTIYIYAKGDSKKREQAEEKVRAILNSSKK